MHRLLLLPVAALLLAGCGNSPDPGARDDDGTTRIVVTTSILGDLVAQLVDDDASVEVLMGPGVDPHAFAPSAAQAQSLREADVVVANGLQLEESLLDTLVSAEEDGVRVVEVGPAVDPIAYGEEDGEHEDDSGDEHEEDEHGEFDPHVWFDAARMAEAVELIAGAISEVDAVLTDDEWAARGAVLRDELRQLDDELTTTYSGIPAERRTLVTNHEAFGYLADAYGLAIVGTVIPGATTQVDTSAADFVELVEVMREEGINVIFAENTTSDRLAEALAVELGSNVRIVQLFSDALGETGSGAETYQGLMRTNADLVVDALG